MHPPADGVRISTKGDFIRDSGHGQVHEWSDIDLVVIEQTQLPFFQRIKKIRKLIKPKVGMDIMVYTPDEFDQLCIDRPFFREEIVAKGKIVYENIR
jgi:hypothetical protein